MRPRRFRRGFQEYKKMLRTFQIIINGGENHPRTGVFQFIAPYTGEIKQIDIWANNQALSGDQIFNFAIGGITQFSGGSRPKVSPSETHSQITDLSFPVTFGDELRFDLESVSGAGLIAPVVFQVTFEDFAPVTAYELAVADGFEGDFTEWLESLQGADGADGSPGSPGADGSIVTFGTSAPSGGNNGDIYLKTDVGEIYKKVSGSWVLQYTDQTGGGASYDGGRPTNALANFFFRDDFIGGSRSTNSAARWRNFGTSPSQIDGEANHPGILRATTATTNNSTSGISLYIDSSGDRMIVPSDYFDMQFVFRPQNVDTGVLLRLGISYNSTLTTATDGIYLERLDGETTFHGVCRSSSSQTRTASLGTAVAATWYAVRIRRIDSSTIGFTLNGGTELTLTTNIPTAGLTPMVLISKQSDSGAKSVDVDYFDVAISGLSRY